MRNAIAGVMVAGLVVGLASGASAQVPITTLGTAYEQNFDGLASANTSSVMPTGWVFLELGANANTTYATGTGSGTTGDTYSFGTGTSTERALGGLLSGNLEPRFGARFVNNTGGAITSITVAYNGEEWRLGAAGRVDRLDFQTSTNATNLDSGTWTDVDALDFETPVTASTGAKDGNAAANRKAITATVPVTWPAGATLWIRWLDFNPGGADDGLAVDDFKLTPSGGAVVLAPVVSVIKDVTPAAAGPIGPTSALTYDIVVNVDASSTQGIATAVLTDVLPADLTPLNATFPIQIGSGAVQNLTYAADGDAATLTGQTLTVNLGTLAAGSDAVLSLDLALDADASAGTRSNIADLNYTGAVDHTAYTASSDAAVVDVVACVNSASGTIPLCDGSITFEIFFDSDGDGIHDSGEPGIFDWDILLEVGELGTTNAIGLVTFTDLPGGVDLDLDDEPPTAVASWNYTLPATVQATPGGTTTVRIAVGCTCPDDGDNNACTSFACFAGTCGATPVVVDCDDHNDCTDDTCSQQDGCIHDPNTDTCDDGNPATRADLCAGSVCAGTPFTCTLGLCEASSVPNGNDCTVTYAGPTAGCDDGESTTRDDLCNGSGGCAGTTYTCTPGACELTSVPNGVGCTATPRPTTDTCSDGNLATKDDHCDGAGACTGTSYTCTPSDPCVTSAPNGTTCVETPLGNGDGCNDQSASTRDDMCNGGICAGTPYTCTATQCQASSLPNGVDCTVTNKLSTATCDDGNAGTQSDHCDGSGGCAGMAYTCTPSQCQASSVPNGVDCTVVNKDASQSCSDGNSSTQSDHCNGSGGCVGTAYTCTPTQCQASSVTNGTDCTVTNKGDTATCDDGSVSTKQDHCDGSGACTGTAYTCTPSQCEASSVANGSDCTITNKTISETCDDGNASTKDDHCNGAGACRGAAFTCTPGPCETSSTPNGSDCTRVLKSPGQSCDDSDACTSDDSCDEVGVCDGDVVTCDPGEVCDSASGCVETHCVACEETSECGAGSACLATTDANRCLRSCTNDDDCGPDQVCREHFVGSLRCYDLTGPCLAPEPNPDAEPEPMPEVGPEPVEDIVEPVPDTTEPTDTGTSDTGTTDTGTGTDGGAEVTVVSGGSGCAGADASLPMLALMAAFALLARLRRRAA